MKSNKEQMIKIEEKEPCHLTSQPADDRDETKNIRNQFYKAIEIWVIFSATRVERQGLSFNSNSVVELSNPVEGRGAFTS